MGNANIKLVEAAYLQDYDGVKKAIDAGADPSNNNVFKDYLLTPHHSYESSAIATAIAGKFHNRLSLNYNKLYKIVELLLDNGADPNATNSYGHSLIYIAAGLHFPELIRLLSSRGGKIYPREKPVGAALVNLAGIDQRRIDETVRALIDIGANLDIGCSSKYKDINRIQECEDKHGKYIWDQIQENVRILSDEYGSDGKLPKDIWKLILLREKQQTLCEDLNNAKNKNILFYFAEYLDIPVTKDMDKLRSCQIISQKLAKS